MILGITGLARTGKDTAAVYLKNRFGFNLVAFADPVYDSVDSIFGINSRAIPDNKKEAVIPPYSLSLRQMLQLVATEFARDMVDKDHWVKRLDTTLDRNSPTIITDIRFQNEFEYVKSIGRIIHITREGRPEVNNHSSENGIDNIEELRDFHIANDGDLRDLVENLYNIVTSLDDYLLNNRFFQC